MAKQDKEEEELSSDAQGEEEAVMKKRRASAGAQAGKEARAREKLVEALTRPEREPTSEQGAPKEGLEGSDVHLSSFELMTVSGAEAEDVNKYLGIEAKRRFRKDLKDITEEQYQALLADKEKFHRWMAKGWVNAFVESRKEELVSLGDELAGHHGSNEPLVSAGRYGYYIPDAWNAVFREPEAATAKLKAEEFKKMKSGLAREVQVRQKRLQDLVGGMQSQHQEMVEVQRRQLEEQGLDQSGIESVVESLTGAYEIARRKFADEQEAAISAFQSEGEESLTKQQRELEDELDGIVKKLQAGPKREMTLAARRWGHTLNALVKLNPDALTVNKETGDVSVDPRELDEDEFQVFVDRFDKELDLILDAKEGRGGSGAKKHNLEALIRSKDEAGLALRYEELLRWRMRSSQDKKQSVERHDLLFSHLRKQGFVDPLDTLRREVELRNAYKEQGRSFPTAVGEVTSVLEANPDLEKAYHALRALPRIIDEYSRNLVTSGIRGGYHLSDSGRNIVRLVETIKGSLEKTNAGDRGWFDLAQTLDNSDKLDIKDFRDFLMPRIYELFTKKGDRLSVISGRYALPNSLEADILRPLDRRGHDIRKEAFEQVRIHFRAWARTAEGRGQIKRVIGELTGRVERRIEKSLSSSEDEKQRDPSSLEQRFQHRVNRMQGVLKDHEKTIEYLKELADEFRG